MLRERKAFELICSHDINIDFIFIHFVVLRFSWGMAVFDGSKPTLAVAVRVAVAWIYVFFSYGLAWQNWNMHHRIYFALNISRTFLHINSSTLSFWLACHFGETPHSFYICRFHFIKIHKAHIGISFSILTAIFKLFSSSIFGVVRSTKRRQIRPFLCDFLKMNDMMYNVQCVCCYMPFRKWIVNLFGKGNFEFHLISPRRCRFIKTWSVAIVRWDLKENGPSFICWNVEISRKNSIHTENSERKDHTQMHTGFCWKLWQNHILLMRFFSAHI